MDNPSGKKNILILGANSDVAKETILRYVKDGHTIVAASRNTFQLHQFLLMHKVQHSSVQVLYFDATAFDTHLPFYNALSVKPHIVIYAAGFLKENVAAMHDWESSFQMMKVHYCGAVSILNIIATDLNNKNLEKIIGLSSLSGVRGRKSNFIYGSTKSAFTQYLAGLRQFLAERNISVNVIVAGYIRSKMTAGLNLPETLMLEPSFIANSITKARQQFIIVPGFKWKIIYQILRLLPENIVAKLP